MVNCFNFFDLAQSACGVDVGFGKMFLLYPEKTELTAADFTADAINTAVEEGDIIGIVRDWVSIVGAPVAETNVERPGSAEMKLIRQEILADTISFESNIVNREVIASLVAAGSVQGVLLDDMGSSFGELAKTVGTLKTMKLNFSGKTSGALQKDNASDKLVAVTVRYLVDEIGMLDTGIETDEIVSKSLLFGQIKEVSIYEPGIGIGVVEFDLQLSEKSTQKAFARAVIAADVAVSVKNATGTSFIVEDASIDANGVMNIHISGDIPDTSMDLTVKIVGDDFLMKETKYTIVPVN